MYIDAIDAIQKIGMITTTNENNNQNVFVQSYYGATETGTAKLNGVMRSDVCAIPAMLALGSRAMNESTSYFGTNHNISTIHWNLARNLVNTCHEFTIKDHFGALPDSIQFYQNGTVKLNAMDMQSLLR